MTMMKKGFPRRRVQQPAVSTLLGTVRQAEKPLGNVKPPTDIVEWAEANLTLPEMVSDAEEAVMNDCRPVEHVKPPPRIVPTSADGRLTERPREPEPAEKPVLPRPAFLTRVKTAPTPASERQTGGCGKVTTPAAPNKVAVPARPDNFLTRQTAALFKVTTAPPPIKLPTAHKGYQGRMNHIDPDEIPF